MRDQLLDFELALDRRSNEEVVDYEWGRAFLSPALPLAWDANWALIERAGMTSAEVVAAAEESLRAYEEVEASGDVLETPLAGCEDLRRELIRAEFSPDMTHLEETADQVLEMGRRTGEAGGDR